MRYAAIVLVLAGCAHDGWRALTPAEVRAEKKACRAVGMEPELIREKGRVMWVTCVESEKARKALGVE